MLNYIWAGLIVSSFVFALGYDARDIAGDRYRNGQPLPVVLAFPHSWMTTPRSPIRTSSSGTRSA